MIQDPNPQPLTHDATTVPQVLLSIAQFLKHDIEYQLSDPMIQWSGDPAIRRSGDPVIWWSGYPVIQWSNDPLMQWSSDPIIQWSSDPVIQWSNDPMIQWSREQNFAEAFQAILSRTQLVRATQSAAFTQSLTKDAL